MPRRAGANVVPTAPAHPLREKGELTRLMILRTLVRAEVVSLRQVADELGVTVQAVSEHVKRLVREGLVTSPSEEGPRVTAAGHEALRARLEALKQYVDGAVRELARIERTAARAGAPIYAGDNVGLFMANGELVAYPKRGSPSRGVAVHSAAKGADVAVEQLEGIVELEPGQVSIGVVPDVAAGGSRKADKARVKRACQDARIVATLGPVAAHLAESSGADPLRFGGAAAAVEAAVRGLDVLVLVEEAGLPELRRRLEEERLRWGIDLEPAVERLF